MPIRQHLVWQAVGLTTRQTGFMSGMLWSANPASFNPDQIKANWLAFQ